MEIGTKVKIKSSGEIGVIKKRYGKIVISVTVPEFEIMKTLHLSHNVRITTINDLELI